MRKQGDPCPSCGVPIYASAPARGCLGMIGSALKSIPTVARGGTGGISMSETPEGPAEATCINCGTIVTVDDTTWPA